MVKQIIEKNALALSCTASCLQKCERRAMRNMKEELRMSGIRRSAVRATGKRLPIGWIVF
ncbi:MAG: hypothetical protein R3C26_26460 [Calditrichia bacterium]